MKKGTDKGVPKLVSSFFRMRRHALHLRSSDGNPSQIRLSPKKRHSHNSLCSAEHPKCRRMEIRLSELDGQRILNAEHVGLITFAPLTRIPVVDVLELVREGISFKTILSDYFPDLQEDDIRACIHYAIDVVQVEDIHTAFI